MKMRYEDLPEFNAVVTDLNNFDSLLQRAGNQRNRVKTMIIQLRASLHALSFAIDALPKQLPLTGAESNGDPLQGRPSWLPPAITEDKQKSSATMPRAKPKSPRGK